MTDRMPNTPLPPDLDPDDVIAWIKANPDFLHQHPHALDHLIPPKQNNGKGVADFQSYMIQRLKADKAQAIETTRDVVETARTNMNSQTRIHNAVLRLLEAHSFDEFIQTITHDLCTMLDTDISTLVVEADGRDIPHINNAGIRIVPEGTVDHWMSTKRILLQTDISGIETIYGSGATLVRSQALVRIDIWHQTPPAILAFGSRDPSFFHPSQGTELVTFLAGVVERLFRSWLLLPH